MKDLKQKIEWLHYHHDISKKTVQKQS